MSKRVIFTCTVLLLIGVQGLFDMLSSFSQGHLNINLFALFLPVSIALFMGLPGSRIAATAVFSINYSFLALLLIGTSIARVQILRSDLLLFANPFPIIIVFVVMLACVLALLHWMLYSPPFDEHLGES